VDRLRLNDAECLKLKQNNYLNKKNSCMDPLLDKIIVWFTTVKAPQLADPFNACREIIEKGTALNEKQREAFGFMLFSYSMNIGPSAFFDVEDLAEKLGVKKLLYCKSDSGKQAGETPRIMPSQMSERSIVFRYVLSEIVCQCPGSFLYCKVCNPPRLSVLTNINPVVSFCLENRVVNKFVFCEGCKRSSHQPVGSNYMHLMRNSDMKMYCAVTLPLCYPQIIFEHFLLSQSSKPCIEGLIT